MCLLLQQSIESVKRIKSIITALNTNLFRRINKGKHFRQFTPEFGSMNLAVRHHMFWIGLKTFSCESGSYIFNEVVIW